MSHSPHEGPGLVLNDECEECQGRTTLPGMANLDNTNLRRLVTLHRHKPPEMGWADQKAVENLRLMGRLVFASGMTKEEAQR